ncbi:hypothetical protein SAMN06296241_2940 [Salinimicrobium sediminis]|uniref:DUF2071 domain-containing protein n=1 Tax=Salinimicrobium sediminis TaxID=1343891 RepID=A0A285X7V2_9FLAO|nr:DUF2071 domain-containing protein [Salinimicrobium sediminis]SOC81365.1 hypothetical protein SAMN06296241_2940 [Salinimicrobium sediminis]
MKLSISSEFRKVALLNYIVPPEVVEKYLPKYTKPDLFNGNCYISLVGFQVKKLKVNDLKVPMIKDLDEIDLQIYVKRFDGASWVKGVVVISRLFDQPGLAELTNTLFKTNYTSVPAMGEVNETEKSIEVKYSWQLNGKEQKFSVKSNKLAAPYDKDTEAAFLLDRPFGFIKAGEEETYLYAIKHASWHLYTVEEYAVNVDFSRQFDPVFNILNSRVPHSVILTEGSTVEIGENVEVSS